MWTESRQSLEVAIHVEKAKDQAVEYPDRCLCQNSDVLFVQEPYQRPGKG